VDSFLSPQPSFGLIPDMFTIIDMIRTLGNACSMIDPLMVKRPAMARHGTEAVNRRSDQVLLVHLPDIHSLPGSQQHRDSRSSLPGFLGRRACDPDLPRKHPMRTVFLPDVHIRIKSNGQDGQGLPYPRCLARGAGRPCKKGTGRISSIPLCYAV